MATVVRGRVLVAGEGAGPVLATTMPLSFWGGLNPATGEVIDRHHPLSGRDVGGHVLVMPAGRGSSSASGVLLDAIVAGHAPAAILMAQPDEIIALGAIVAQEVFGRSLPVLVLDAAAFARALSASSACIGQDGRVELSTDELPAIGGSYRQ